MFCRKCGNYTLKKECCGEKTVEHRPPKYAPKGKQSFLDEADGNNKIA